MQTVKPPRYTLEDHGDRLKITIPARKSWRLIFDVPTMLFFWGLTAILAPASICTMLTDMLRGIDLGHLFVLVFMLLFWCIWFVIGGYKVYSILWQLFGREIIWIDAGTIQANRHLWGIDRIKSYQSEQIQQIRVYQHIGCDRNPTIGLPHDLPIPYHPLTFDYGPNAIHVALEATKAENEQLLKLILARFPQYGGE